MRLDKFLKVSRILKRRSVAQEACDGQKVDVNGKPAKPGHKLKIGDLVCVHFASGSLTFRVVDLKETVKKDEASQLYEIVLD
ncbi:MAG: RNA-binding S4 domain-containing protein [Clostridia bacterium]|nr:RNA-binding S4 domain-containing protein [Clostridia bacterium]MBQ3066888.1 RNA-binding S4 domain-containing protein [Clostridia bacterium]MBR2966769.1 RNA-binding S4 domain-containing protein [Clostridia bacterium]